MTDDLSSPARYNLEMEENVLGVALFGKQLNFIVSELTPADFYRPLHASIFAAIVDLHQNGYKVDPYTVSDAMKKSGDVAAVGGSEQLYQLTTIFPNYANIGSYVAIVRRESAARLLYTSIAEARNALNAQEDPAEVADFLSESLKGVDRGGQLPERYWRSWDDYSVAEREGLGEPLIQGMVNRHTRVIVLASEKSGKALAIDTPMPTPKGWTTMGEVKVGHYVFSPDGKPVLVVGATEIMRGHDCYRVTFKDGRSIVADGGHLWKTNSYAERQNTNREKPARFSIRTTRDLADAVTARDGHTLNHQIPTCEPLNFTSLGSLPIGPYTLGAWLGDGTSASSSITCADPQILNEIRSEGYIIKQYPNMRWMISSPEKAKLMEIAKAMYAQGYSLSQIGRNTGFHRGTVKSHAQRGGWVKGEHQSFPITRPLVQPPPSLQKTLRMVGVLGNKHIPDQYFQAPVNDRLSLLQGLMDTDGHISGRRGMSRCEFCVCSEALARGFYRLVTELGIKAFWDERDAKLNGRVVGTRYRITFQTSLPVFRLRRKADIQKPLLTTVSERRAIVSIDKVPSVPVKCIQIQNPDGMYVAGEGCIPTHNSNWLRQASFCAAAGLHPFTLKAIESVRVLVLDAENDDEELMPTSDKIRALLGKNPLAKEGRPSLFSAPYGMDLRSRRDISELEEVLQDCRPQLIVGGPLYKLMPRREREDLDTHASAMQRILDGFRRRYGCALILEHHAPTGKQGEARELRSKGGQQWQAWPEVTVALHQRIIHNGTTSLDVKFPHPTRGKFNWPKRLDRGIGSGEWPWVPVMRDHRDDQPPIPDHAPEPGF